MTENYSLKMEGHKKVEYYYQQVNVLPSNLLGLGSYDDAPDGEQCVQKLLIGAKYGFATGLYFAVHDWAVTPKPDKLLTPRLLRGLLVGSRPFLLITSFPILVCVLTNMRKKDDKLNYFLGGGTPAFVGGLFYNNLFTGCMSGLFVGLIALGFKEMKLNNYVMDNNDIVDYTHWFDKTLYINKKSAQQIE